jgi:hypothetical protein
MACTTSRTRARSPRCYPSPVGTSAVTTALLCWIGKVEPSRQTPRNAIFVFVGIASALILVWALLHLIGGHSGSMNGLTYFDESGTMGTILVLVVYFLSNLALPFCYRRYRARRVQRAQARHPPGAGDGRDRHPGLLPVQAAADGSLRLVPVRGTDHPGRLFCLRVHPDQARPGLGERVGSIVADE